MTNIGIIGYGIIGSTTGKVFSKEHTIFPYDKYKEPYNTQESLDSLVENSEAVFICVSTPMESSGKIDYSAIHDSLSKLTDTSNKLGKNLEDLLVVIRSTAVSGSSDKFAENYNFRFAVNPEFLRENHALEDMENTDRVILGVENEKDEKDMLNIYKPIFPDAHYTIVNKRTAEMIKYAANVMLTGQISVANEIYQICKAVDVTYDKVKKAVLLDERIGKNIDVPGPDGDLGFGGKCFPKDLNALIHVAREKEYRPYLLEEMWRLNEKVRKDKDWEKIPGATSENNDFHKK